MRTKQYDMEHSQSPYMVFLWVSFSKIEKILNKSVIYIH